MKFKLGDQAKIIANSSGHEFKNATEVRIIRLSRTGHLAENSEGESWFVNESDLEPIVSEEMTADTSDNAPNSPAVFIKDEATGTDSESAPIASADAGTDVCESSDA